LESRYCKGSDRGEQQSPQQQGGHHGNQATVHLQGTYQHNTERSSVWNEYLPKNVGGRERNKASKLASDVSKVHGNAPVNLPGTPHIILVKLLHWLGFNLV